MRSFPCGSRRTADISQSDFASTASYGIVRALLLSGFARASAWKDGRKKRPQIDPETFVSVLIPAFNEERVIERSVRQVLESVDVQLEVIVIDDGSRDRTSPIVKECFGADPRVRLLTLENSGKARALNRGLALANGEFVVA